MGLLFGKKKCPRCDSKNLKVVKPSMWRQLSATFINPPKNLNVCRACGFSWEDR